jgi:hypothetical protein
MTVSPTMPARVSPVRWLTCCVCGERCRGRQWWNRDTGYGLCEACADGITRSQSAEEHRQCYGIRGVHFAIPETD